MSGVVVGMLALRQALLAVRPHVAPPKAEIPVLQRVHCVLTGPELELHATNRVSAGLALVRVVEHDTGEAVVFDLHPHEVAELLLAFAPPKDDAMDATVRLGIGAAAVKVTDVSGLFPGQSVSFPRTGDAEAYPALASTFHGLLVADEPARERIVANGPLLASFAQAARAYGQPLVVQQAGKKGTLLVSCGDAFLGALQPVTAAEDTLAEHEAAREAWVERLGGPR